MPQANFQTQFQRLRQREELLAIMLFLFVIVVFWIIVSVFSSQQTTGVEAAQQKLAAPLSPSLDLSVIDTLEQKKIYSSPELSDFPVYTIASSSAEVSVSGEAPAAEEIVLPADLESTLQSLEEGL
jgi:hypothetical protein